MAAQHRSQGTPSPRKRKRSVITSASALPPNGGAGGVLAPNAKWARGKRRAGPVSAERSRAARPSWRRYRRTTSGSSCGCIRPAAPSAKCCLRAAGLREYRRGGGGSGARERPSPAKLTPGCVSCRAFTFRRTHSPAAGPAALRDKDVNTSLGSGGVARPKDLRVGPPGARPALPGPAGSSGPTAGAPPGSVSVSLPSAGPAACTGDEWDDMDDFDLSGFEKKFSRPAVLSPKGPRTPQGRGLHVSKARADVGPQEHGSEVSCSQGSSQGSLICLGDAGAPAAAVLSDNGMEEARAGEGVCRSTGILAC